jgi:hypothetical protein
MAQNASVDYGGAASGGGQSAFAPGQISVRADVNVSFKMRASNK